MLIFVYVSLYFDYNCTIHVVKTAGVQTRSSRPALISRFPKWVRVRAPLTALLVPVLANKALLDLTRRRGASRRCKQF